MPTDALVLAPAILAVVLVVSAVGKLRSPRASAEAFRDLRVPALLSGHGAVRGLPWAEIALAVALVLLGGRPGVLASVATLVLFTAYLWLVVRGLGFDVPVDCACFGEFAPGRITRGTVVRNAWLVALAVLAVVASTQGSSVATRLADGGAPWWWVAGAVAAAVTVRLVVGGSGPAAELDEQAALVEEEGEYLRVRTPALPVTLGDGSTTTLRRLSETRPQLLVYVSETCGSCREVIDAVPGWREQLPQLDVRILVRADPESSGLASTQEPLSVHDAEGLVYETFDLRTPGAVLLGADGLLAGGPVIGSLAVPEFVDDVRAELVEAVG